MARNEEKQLARLNRFYLEKQKQEELKKRPPRPRLDTLNTSRELRKWLPTITRDIEFYVKQMEVTCYTDGKIEEITERIQRLKQEYRAYLHKLRALEPDVSAATWGNRPYAHRKRPAEGDDTKPAASHSHSTSGGGGQTFTPISTPILHQLTPDLDLYGPQQTPVIPVECHVNPDTQDTPLRFSPPAKVSAVTDSGGERQGGVALSQDTPLQFHTPFKVPAVTHNDAKKQGGVSSSQDTPLQFHTPCNVSAITHNDAKECGAKALTIHTDCGVKTSTVHTDCGVKTSTIHTDCGVKTSTIHTDCGVKTSTIHTDCDVKTSTIHTDCGEKTLTIHTDCGVKTSVIRVTCGEDSLPQTQTHTAATCVHATTLSTSNPLNLDYSDSSDEDL